MADLDLRTAALDYHRLPVPGKLAITATKQLINQRDLALAYSPGVAAATRPDCHLHPSPGTHSPALHTSSADPSRKGDGALDSSAAFCLSNPYSQGRVAPRKNSLHLPGVLRKTGKRADMHD